MANPKHLEKLLEGVDAWNHWRIENPKLVPRLREADLNRAILSETDLSHAILLEAKLRGANLGGASLIEANLSGADLSGANLSGANLVGANLNRAILRGANLFRARLCEADLYESDLRSASLVAADLQEANLRDASLGGTIFAEIDFSKTHGLRSCCHFGSSTIDHRTLASSRELPIEFLRGCGLPDWMIDGYYGFEAGPIQFYSCFISYSSEDDEFAQRLHADLQDNGVRCWFSPVDLRIGDPVRKTIDEAIRMRDKLVLILSKNSIESDWVEHEVNRALEEEKEHDKLVLFPIRIDNSVMDVDFGWAKAIREAHKPTGRHIGDFTHWKDHDAYQKAFDRLLRDLKSPPSRQQNRPDAPRIEKTTG